MTNESNMKILKGMVSCLHCNYAFTYTSPKLVSCSGYRTKKTCDYVSWREEDVLEVLREHLDRRGIELKLNIEFLNKHIDKIYIGRDATYRIEFTDNTYCGWDGCSLIL